jgi:uncharacterized protein YjbI with pentapeptide repeats
MGSFLAGSLLSILVTLLLVALVVRYRRLVRRIPSATPMSRPADRGPAEVTRGTIHSSAQRARPGESWGDIPPLDRREHLWGLLENQRKSVALTSGGPPAAASPAPTDGNGSRLTDERLTGADVFWLCVLHLSHFPAVMTLEEFGDDYLQVLLTSQIATALNFVDPDLQDEWRDKRVAFPSPDVSDAFLVDPEIPMLRGLDLRGVALEGADLNGAMLDGVDLRGCDLTRAQLVGAHLRLSLLDDAYLDGVFAASASFRGARMQRCYARLADFTASDLRDVDMTGAVARRARFDAANLGTATLVRCKLTSASFRSARLFQTRLAGSRLMMAKFGPVGIDATIESQLEQAGWLGFVTDETPAQRLERAADLSLARFDAETELQDARIWSETDDNPQIADGVWGDVNLAVVKGWTAKTGDETRAERSRDPSDYDRAARANRQLAVQLRRQGITDSSDFYGYRAKVCDLRAFRLQRRWLQLAGNSILGALCGWGFRPAQTIVWYLAIILSWWGGYRVTVPKLSVWQDLVLSVSAFHGRGVFISNLQSLTTGASVLVVTEAVLGLLIEVTFVATFTQRFLAR